jgi:hypothetical protein
MSIACTNAPRVSASSAILGGRVGRSLVPKPGKSGARIRRVLRGGCQAARLASRQGFSDAICRWRLRPAILRRPVYHLKSKLTVSERRDDQPAGCERSVGLVVTRAAHRNEAIEVEVRAAARALDDVVDVQAAAAAAGLAAPPGPTADFTLNRLPFPCVRKTSGRIP